MKYSLSILILRTVRKIIKASLDYGSIAALGLWLLTCQANRSSENPTSSSGSAPAGTSLSQPERILRKVNRIYQLQEQLRTELDSLNSLDTNSELRSYSDTLQKSYFILADAEEAWVSFRTQYATQFDSLGDSSQMAAYRPASDSLEQLLDVSIKQTEQSVSVRSGTK